MWIVANSRLEWRLTGSESTSVALFTFGGAARGHVVGRICHHALLPIAGQGRVFKILNASLALEVADS